MACQWCTMPDGKHDGGCPYDAEAGTRLEAERVIVSPEDYHALVAAIENPPPPSEKLTELLRRKPVWEE